MCVDAYVSWLNVVCSCVHVQCMDVVRMHVHMHVVRPCVCMHVYIHVVRPSVCIHVCMHVVRPSMRMHVCMHVCMHVVRPCVCMYVCKYVCPQCFRNLSRREAIASNRIWIQKTYSEASKGTRTTSQCGCTTCEHGPGDPQQTCNGEHYLCYKCTATCGGEYWVCQRCLQNGVHTKSACEPLNS